MKITITQRSLFRRRVLWGVGLVVFVLAALNSCAIWTVLVTNPKLSPRTEARSDGKSFVKPGAGGVPIVHLHGTPYERGHAHGAMLKDEIRTLYENYLGIIVTYTYGRNDYLKVARAMLPHMPEAYVEEMRGIADGAGTGLSFDDVLVANVFLDVSQQVGCSTFTLDESRVSDPQDIMLGRNLDFTSLNIAGRYSHVFVHHGTGGHDVLAPSWPGLVGAVSGMNDKGLALAMMLVPSEELNSASMPYAMLYRQILERAATAEQARVTLLELGCRASVTNNLTIFDVNGEGFVAEIEPNRGGAAQVRFREECAGCAFSTNHFNEEHGELETDPYGNSYERWDLMKTKLAGEKPLTVDDAKALLKELAMDGKNLQSMIFLPRRREMLLAAIGPDAVERPYESYNLDRLLGHSP
ncbi:MAG: C45 family peptidase [Planctomycetes bacterium]|nr:C45 family peptidase [Planctomycetota bacterium]NUQ35915.1 hypothetical protein [Planctomycetaceae bacterium]